MAKLVLLRHGESDMSTPARGSRWLGLAGWVGLCLAVEAVASYLTSLSVETWYVDLRKPGWTPPGWLFGPVWTALYVSMGVAAWLVWRKRGFRGGAGPLSLFLIQLVLNGGWSAIFFALRAPGVAFVEIVLLWLAIAATVRAFFGVSRAAGWLLVPYQTWVTYAAALNLAIWRLNS